MMDRGHKSRGVSAQKRMLQQKEKSMDALGRYPIDAVSTPARGGSGFTVRRSELLRTIVKQARLTGVVLLCAPRGFGKTALLLQYAEDVASDPNRGVVRIVDAAGLAAEALDERLAILQEGLMREARPLIAIDGVPVLKEGAARLIAARVRSMRDAGFEVLLSLTPANTELLRALGDSAKIGGQALKVRPREYGQWAKTFSILNAIDVYGCTQGVPCLIASLSAATAGDDDSALEHAVERVYRDVLAELRTLGGSLARLVSLMLLFGHGSFAEIERCGLRVKPELLARLVHDYPVFGIDASTARFACMGSPAGALKQLRTVVASERPGFVTKAIRSQVKSGRIDDAAELLRSYLIPEAASAIIAQFPVKFALAGHGKLVADVLDAAAVPSRADERDVGELLALYASALTMGDMKWARALARALGTRAADIQRDIAPRDWDCALALRELWSTCRGIDLPDLSEGYPPHRPSEEALEIRYLSEALRLGLAGETVPDLPDAPARAPEGADEAAVELDLPGIFARAGEMLLEVLRGGFTVAGKRDVEFADLSGELRERHLGPVATLVRLVVSLRELFGGVAVQDPRAFQDAGAMASRISAHGMQLLSMMCEGWSNLVQGQMVNAQFRAQQVERLAGEGDGLLAAWSYLLEKTAHICNTSRVALHEEAELVDLEHTAESGARAWATAFLLSATRFDSELSAWFSHEHDAMLEQGLRPPARLAIKVLGDRADPLRRLIAPRWNGELLFEGGAASLGTDALKVESAPISELGQIDIKLFGGFQASKNGHVLTDSIWRRRKTSILAARLALALGSFVSRRVIAEELWPDCSDYTKARDSLYTALSTLRSALGQHRDGPQYVISQGEGIAINTEYVSSDVIVFDQLSRLVLVKQPVAASAPQMIETCLKIEQIYAGPLYVPDKGSPSYFTHMRDILKNRFADCMLQGAHAALDEGDLSSASWMVEAALRQLPGREDVVRAAMRVFDLSGRRREVVDIYKGHLHLLAHEAEQIPEPETRRLYEEIIGRARSHGIM